MRSVLLSALLLAPFVTDAPRAQEPESRPVHCKTCAGHGHRPCKKHKKSLALEQADFVRGCSVTIGCKTCNGALAVDCKRCDDPASDRELERRRTLGQELLQGRRQHLEKAPGFDELMYLDTTHYGLTFSLRAATIGRKKVDPHTLMHLYGQRLEELRSLFASTLELTDADLPDHMRVYMFHDQKDHGLIGPQETGMGSASSTGLKLMGPKFVYSMWHDKRSMRDDDGVHRNIVHNVCHLLISQMRPQRYLGNKKQGWIDEGLASWFEDKIVGKCLNYCFEEVLTQPGVSYKGGSWRVPIRKLVDTDKAASFAAIAQRNTGELTLEEHAVSFGYVDFLIQTKGGAKIRDYLRLVKDGKETRDALKQAFGLTPLTIEPAFREWVTANYPLR